MSRVTESSVSPLGRNLARFRREAKLSAEEVAARAGNGLTRSVIANLENGRKEDVTVGQLLALAFAVGVSPAYLVFDLYDPYGTTQIPVAEGEPVEIQTWLAFDWFGARRSITETQPVANGEVVNPEVSGEHMWLISYQLRLRGSNLQALTAHEERLAALRKDPLASEPHEFVGYDLDHIRSRIREFRAELYEIDGTLRKLGVQIDKPVVNPGDPIPF